MHIFFLLLAMLLPGSWAAEHSQYVDPIEACIAAYGEYNDEGRLVIPHRRIVRILLEDNRTLNPFRAFVKRPVIGLIGFIEHLEELGYQMGLWDIVNTLEFQDGPEAFEFLFDRLNESDQIFVAQAVLGCPAFDADRIRFLLDKLENNLDRVLRTLTIPIHNLSVLEFLFYNERALEVSTILDLELVGVSQARAFLKKRLLLLPRLTRCQQRLYASIFERYLKLYIDNYHLMLHIGFFLDNETYRSSVLVRFLTKETVNTLLQSCIGRLVIHTVLIKALEFGCDDLTDLLRSRKYRVPTDLIPVNQETTRYLTRLVSPAALALFRSSLNEILPREIVRVIVKIMVAKGYLEEYGELAC